MGYSIKKKFEHSIDIFAEAKLSIKEATANIKRLVPDMPQEVIKESGIR
jgi:hypothetical protein